MSNISEILANRGVGTQGIKMDEKGFRAMYQKVQLLWAYVNTLGLSGYEVVNNGQVITHNDELIYLVPANAEIPVIITPPAP